MITDRYEWMHIKINLIVITIFLCGVVIGVYSGRLYSKSECDKNNGITLNGKYYYCSHMLD